MGVEVSAGAVAVNLPLGPCVVDPERWTAAIDDGAKQLCRSCPRRWSCARDACESPDAEGLWAGIVIPESGRGRAFALRQLRSLAERNGFPVNVERGRTTTKAIADADGGCHDGISEL